MTWIRIDADMPWNDKVTGLPSDMARFAYIKLLCAAKVRGRSSFSERSLREALGSHARAISSLLAAGLLEKEGSVLTVHDFDEYQRKAQQTERQQRHRSVTSALHDRDNGVTETLPTGRDGTGRNGTPSISPPSQTFMGWQPRADDQSHHGQHPDCLVCHPVIPSKKEGAA